MFYRRKIILALLEIFENELDKIRLQKLLFLFCQRQTKAEYEFIPYKYGCFSYSANADLTAMVGKGMLSEEGSNIIREDKTSYLKSLKADDQIFLRQIQVQYGKMSANALMKHTYTNYPYWAIHSVKAREILNSKELAQVEEQKPTNGETVLYTIGYEGNSLENYLNRLIQNNVKVLVDVRNNPLSMKFGFSKNQLQRYCEYLGIKYMHFPEVGIRSEFRQELNSQVDYDRLFASYRTNNLTHTRDTQIKILKLLEEHGRIALTCFEAEPCQCHRSHLADAIKALPDFNYEVKHI